MWSQLEKWIEKNRIKKGCHDLHHIFLKLALFLFNWNFTNKKNVSIDFLNMMKKPPSNNYCSNISNFFMELGALYLRYIIALLYFFFIYNNNANLTSKRIILKSNISYCNTSEATMYDLRFKIKTGKTNELFLKCNVSLIFANMWATHATTLSHWLICRSLNCVLTKN